MKISEYYNVLKNYLDDDFFDGSTAHIVKTIITDLDFLCEYFATYEEYNFLIDIYGAFFSKSFSSTSKQYVEDSTHPIDASYLGFKGTSKIVLTMLYEHLELNDSQYTTPRNFFLDLNDLLEEDDSILQEQFSGNDLEKIKVFNSYLQTYSDFIKSDYIDFSKVLLSSTKDLSRKSLKIFDFLQYKNRAKVFTCNIDTLCEKYLHQENTVKDLENLFSVSLDRESGINVSDLMCTMVYIAKIRTYLFSQAIDGKNLYNVGEISEYKGRKYPALSISTNKSYRELRSEIVTIRELLQHEIEAILEIDWIKSKLFDYFMDRNVELSYRDFGKQILFDIKEKYDKAYENKKLKCEMFSYDLGIDLCFPGKNSTRYGRCSYDCVVRYNKKEVSFLEICEELTEFSTVNNIKDEAGKMLRYTATVPIHDPQTQTEYDSNMIDNFIKKRNLKYSVQELVYLISFIAIIEEFNFPKFPNANKYRGRKDCFGRYVESLYGGREELKKIKHKLCERGTRFEEQSKYREYYCSNIIDRDRWKLEDFDSV